MQELPSTIQFLPAPFAHAARANAESDSSLEVAEPDVRNETRGLQRIVQRFRA